MLLDDAGGPGGPGEDRGSHSGRAHVIASEPHFLDHLLPVWRALPEQNRGAVYTGTSGNKSAEVVARADQLGVRVEGAFPSGQGSFLVAAYGDLLRAQQYGPVAFAEHGCGMRWTGAGEASASYAGSTEREGVSLILAPNPMVAEVQRRSTPLIRVVDLGSEPRLDRWADRGEPSGDVVAVSFHWDAEVVPETRTCLWHYRRVLEELGRRFRVIGHAHPRIWEAARAVYLDAGIEPVQDFDEVVDRASLYCCDVSSTMYEFAAVGGRVLALNRPEYRRDVDHGLRFWQLVPGLQCDSPDDLGSMVALALEDPPEAAWLRRQAVSTVFPRNDGRASERAAQAVLEWLGDQPRVQGPGYGRRVPLWVVELPDGSAEEYLVEWEARRRAETSGGSVAHYV